jgi:CheY-like chemotaxis protein
LQHLCLYAVLLREIMDKQMERKGHILYAEDHDDTREMMVFLLEQAGFQMTAVCTGEETYELARQNQYDLILLNHTFPDMSGVATCAAIREFDSHIPILFYSTRAFQKEIDQAMNAGASAYLIKPQDLLAVAEHATRLIQEAIPKSPSSAC